MKWTLERVEKETEPKCHHCGTNIKYVCWIKSDEGEEMAVGVECCGNFLSRNGAAKAKGEKKSLVEYYRRKAIAESREYTKEHTLDFLRKFYTAVSIMERDPDLSPLIKSQYGI